MEHTLRLKIQSFSDVITNSSSELFCTIFSDNHLNDIYEFLSKIFDKNCYEDSINIYQVKKDKYYDEDCFKEYPDNWIELHVPYDYYNILKVLQVGVESMLDNKFKDEYKIIFE